jgi:predicted porin
MTKTRIGALAGAALLAGAAHAQGTPPAPSNVTLYGLLDVGLEYVDNVGAAGASLRRMPANTGSLPSRLGFRGSEDLGGGLRAVFTLESGLNLDTGLLGQGGRLFGRQAFAGLSGSWGTVSVGRQYTMLFWSLQDADILGPNIYGSGSIDAYIPNARADNSIAWRGSFGGFTAGATYSLGRDAVNAGPSPAGTNCAGESFADSRQCREASLLLKYDTDRWGVAGVVDRIHGGPGAFGGLTTSAATDTRSMVNGWWKTGGLKLGGGYLQRKTGGVAAASSDLYFVGASYALTPALTVDGVVFRLDVRNSPNEATLLGLRGTYSLSRRSALYATVGQIENEGTSALSVSGGQPGSSPAPGGSQKGITVGMRHVF